MAHVLEGGRVRHLEAQQEHVRVGVRQGAEAVVALLEDKQERIMIKVLRRLKKYNGGVKGKKKERQKNINANTVLVYVREIN